MKQTYPHITRDAIRIDRPFILTTDKTLVYGMPYLFSEGSYSIAVRLLKTWVEDDNIIYLNVQELQTDRTFTVNWNLDYNGDYSMWTLADLPTIMKATK